MTNDNPKHAAGALKLPLHLWPPAATALGALAMSAGATLYGRNNWRETRVLASDYRAALQRHLDLWFEGEDCDQKSGYPHMAHVLACAAIIVDADTSGTLIDDRNRAGNYAELAECLTRIFASRSARGGAG